MEMTMLPSSLLGLMSHRVWFCEIDAFSDMRRELHCFFFYVLH